MNSLDGALLTSESSYVVVRCWYSAYVGLEHGGLTILRARSGVKVVRIQYAYMVAV
jgi:hypothetical protein